MRVPSAASAAAFVALTLAACASAGLGIDLARPNASLGLAERPGLGVTCGNLTTCGRIGIAVWLKKPALSVDAELVGASVGMHEGRTTRFDGQGPKYWEGFVRIDRHRLRLPVYWYGNKPVRFLVLNLTIRYPNRTAQGAVRVQLQPGWG